jgi:hypothetical protein
LHFANGPPGLVLRFGFRPCPADLSAGGQFVVQKLPAGPGVDFMKPFWPKFTKHNGVKFWFVIMNFNGYGIP